MSYCIIIRGPLGIGKSTIAVKLAEALKGKYISIDSILKKNDLDHIDEKEGCITLKNFIKANEIELPVILNSLKQGKIVVIDGNFYHKEQIEHLEKELNVSCYVFTLKAPLKICIERDSKRTKAYGIEATKAVYNLVFRFDYGEVINIGDKTTEEVVEEIISHLPKPNTYI